EHGRRREDERAADPSAKVFRKGACDTRPRAASPQSAISQRPAAIAQGFAVGSSLDAPAFALYRSGGISGMSTFASLSTQERIAFLQEAAARLNVLPMIAEKDFWVCWMFGRIFSAPSLAEHVV